MCGLWCGLWWSELRGSARAGGRLYQLLGVVTYVACGVAGTVQEQAVQPSLAHGGGRLYYLLGVVTYVACGVAGTVEERAVRPCP